MMRHAMTMQCALLLALACLPPGALAQKHKDVEEIGARDINRGSWNFYSIEREIELGRQLAGQVESTSLLLRDREVQAYVNELVQRLDTLKRGTQDTWEKTLRDALREMLDPESQRYVEVMIGYPLGIAQYPALSIVLDSGGENTGEAIAGDEHHRFNTISKPTAVSPPTVATVPITEHLLTRNRVMGTGETSVVQIAAWAVAPERSLLLQAAARWALFHEKGLFQKRGVHDITWREGGVEPSEELAPRIAYLPMLIVTLSWTFRETRRERAANRVTIGAGTFSA